MPRLNIVTNVFLCVTLLTFAGPVLACKWKMDSVSEYVHNQIPDRVIFQGAVLSVEEKKLAEGVFTQRIKFRTTRWFGGKAQEIISIRGGIGSGSGSCKGVFDFSANAGETWLIFGRLHKGEVYPDPFVSKKLVNGEIPAHF